LWTFHLYVAPFQQNLHNANISLRWYDISELVAPIRISLLEDASNTEATAIKVLFCKGEVITSKMLRSPSWLGWPLWINVSQWPPICSTYRKHFTVLYSFMTYYWVCNYINTTSATSGSGSIDPSGAPEFTPVFSGTPVTGPFALYVCLVDCCFSFCTFSFRHCVVCSLIYGFWLPLWSLQTLLSKVIELLTI
jgi:hypothetical protein